MVLASATVLLACASLVAQRVTLTANVATAIRDALTRHAAALQSGDVAAIRDSLSGKALEQNRALLEKNTEYPAFLRNFYQGATFSVGNIVPDGNKEVVTDLIIRFPNGAQTVTKLRLRSEGKAWKIVGQGNSDRS
jgi:hypothetical protein